jgi:hypothetical protein
METLRIRRFDTRYRMPASILGQRDRLDRVLRHVLDDGADRALERIGVDPTEAICLRRLDVPLRLRLAASDAALVATWSVGLAQAIEHALRAGSGDVVRYGSRARALLDLVVSSARGSFERRWAWRQLGLWEDGRSVGDAVVSALLREPTTIVSVLVEAARADVLASLVGLLPAAGWSMLAEVATAAAGRTVALEAPPESAPTAPTSDPLVARVLAGSVLVAEWRRAQLWTAPGDVHCAVALLAAVEVEPLVVRRPEALARAAIASVATELGAQGPFGSPTGEARRTSATERSAAGTSDAPPARDGDLVVGGLHPRARCRARTRYGGLLYLLHLVDELALADRLAVDARLEARSLRWVLHRLALGLVRAEADDPAVLAFSGLTPADPSPSLGEPEPSAAETLALAEYGETIVAQLRAWLVRPDEPVATLLRSVAWRDAEIVADMGWIDVRLSLDDVTTEIRRAALDLDLGWIPWLGVVVRFVYA